MTKIPRNFMILICVNFIELIIRYVYNYSGKFHIKFGSNVDNDNVTQMQKCHRKIYCSQAFWWNHKKKSHRYCKIFLFYYFVCLQVCLSPLGMSVPNEPGSSERTTNTPTNPFDFQRALLTWTILLISVAL